MLQFYFLSILLNLLAGLIFIYAAGEGDKEPSDFGDYEEKSTESDSEAEKTPGLLNLASPFLGDKTLQLVVGILSGLTGLMKLLSPIQYDIVVVGDLIPALAGITACAVLLLDWYQDRSEMELSLPEVLQTFYTSGRKYVGIFCIIAAFLHFIFPRVLFL